MAQMGNIDAIVQCRFKDIDALLSANLPAVNLNRYFYDFLPLLFSGFKLFLILCSLFTHSDDL